MLKHLTHVSIITNRRAMPPHSIIITGCTIERFRQFVASNMQNLDLKLETDERDVLCFVPSNNLEQAFARMMEESRKGWENPDSQDALGFDSAFFPYSEERLLPMRQLRGSVAARLARKRDSLPPAYATPGFVFGTVQSED